MSTLRPSHKDSLLGRVQKAFALLADKDRYFKKTSLLQDQSRAPRSSTATYSGEFANGTQGALKSAPSAKTGSIFSSRCSKRQARSTKASRKQTSFSRTVKFGGASRDRTDDLKLAKLPLSQLSYGPVSKPLNRTQNIWWAWKDLNFRPHAYQARALTN